jgi:hypothetical protein
MNTIQSFFGWPEGGVWSNILASMIWTTPSFIVGFFIGHRQLVSHMRRHHQEVMAHIRKIHKHLGIQ